MVSMVDEKTNDYPACAAWVDKLVMFLPDHRDKPRHTPNRDGWGDFLAGFAPPKRVDGLALVGPLSVKEAKKNSYHQPVLRGVTTVSQRFSFRFLFLMNALWIDFNTVT